MQKTFEQWALELVAAGKDLYTRGVVPATSGNFSAKVSDDEIAITVSGSHKGHLTVDDIMMIDPQGRSLDDREPSAETGLHLQVYSQYPDASIVLHHHSLYATMLSMALEGNKLQLSGYELLKAFQGVDTHEYDLEIPVFENNQNISQLAESVQRYMDSGGPCYGYLIRGHGLYTWAESRASVLKYVEAFEFLFKCELMKRGMKPI